MASDTNTTDNKALEYLSRVNREKIDRIYAAVIYELAVKNRCTEPRLTAATLAKEFGVSTRIFSAVMNLRFNTSFNNVLNHYRILQVTYMMKDSRNKELSCDDIAFACGFSNHMTFYTAFKHEIGKTPSVFRNETQTF